MIFRGLNSLDDLLKKAEDISDANKSSRINQVINKIKELHTSGKPFQIEDREGTLDSSSYMKLINSLEDFLKDSSEKEIKNLSDVLELSSESEEAFKKFIAIGEGDAENIANLLSSDMVAYKKSDLEEDISKKTIQGKDLGKSIEWPHPVVEGSLWNTWTKMAEDKKVPLLESIIEFFKENPDPDDDEIHSFAEDNNIDPHELEEEVYSILGALLGKGRSNLPENKDKEFDEDQTEKGIEVEQEHFEGADLPQEIIDTLAEKINNDHLSEGDKFNEEYYDSLLDMEDELKK